MALNVFNDLAKFLTPPPPYTSAEYDGLEYRYRMLVFRPALFKLEALFIAGIALYVAWFVIGKNINKRKAEAWLNANFQVLGSQFSKPTNNPDAGLIADGYSDFFNFSTGRKHVASLHAVLTLLPRQDLATSLYRLFWGIIDLTKTNEDEVELDFKLSKEGQGFVWGVVSKECLSGIRKERWDLTLTRTSESPLLGGGFVVMSEYADITEQILKYSEIAKALNDPVVRPLIKSITITDQPRDRPTVPVPPHERSRHVIVTLRLPSSSAHSTAPLLKSTLGLIDALESPSTRIVFKPETRTKLRKTREELDESLRKEAEEERRVEVEEEKARERKRKEDERLGKLSKKGQEKELEKERKRAMRKAQGKMSRK